MLKYIMLFLILATSSFAQTITVAGTACKQYLKVGGVYTFIGTDGVQTKATIARVDYDGKVILKSKAGTTVGVTISDCGGDQKSFINWWAHIREKLRDYLKDL